MGCDLHASQTQQQDQGRSFKRNPSSIQIALKKYKEANEGGAVSDAQAVLRQSKIIKGVARGSFEPHA
jgi:hypothetical protein